MSELIFGSDLFEEVERLHRQMASVFSGLPSSIRASRFGIYPQFNIGSTDDSVEIVVFAPGIDPSKLEVTVDKGLLRNLGRIWLRVDYPPQYAHYDKREHSANTHNPKLSWSCRSKSLACAYTCCSDPPGPNVKATRTKTAVTQWKNWATAP
jgi:hypothetical protein